MKNFVDRYSLEEVMDMIQKNHDKRNLRCECNTGDINITFFSYDETGIVLSGCFSIQKEQEKQDFVYSVISCINEKLCEVFITVRHDFLTAKSIIISDDLNEINEKIEKSFQNGNMDREHFENYKKQIKEQKLKDLF